MSLVDNHPRQNSQNNAFVPSLMLSAAENIDLFLADLETKEPQLTQLLRQNLKKILPLPEETTDRTSARIAFNSAIAMALAQASDI